ncbi:unnamed protein product [Bursaphelenchus xylophilus]|uniref:(pine wood nematode) hypothetical protein n=1 Tax=Bursaphelenchus xylophilus TaxID=6326 RepID=A0A1I7SRG7_BURXY|nr:unnamed protein product [Bursaphelenchus xylophilus]CAG9102424.1 unnamed protein product [Bursaphelenchus xylophilus]
MAAQTTRPRPRNYLYVEEEDEFSKRIEIRKEDVHRILRSIEGRTHPREPVRIAQKLSGRIYRFAVNHFSRLLSGKKPATPPEPTQRLKKPPKFSKLDRYVSIHNATFYDVAFVNGEEFPSRVRELLSQPPPPLPRQIRHGWGLSFSSWNMFHDSEEMDELTIGRLPVAQSTDLARGNLGYINGLRIWEVKWPVNQRGTHAVIGVCTSAQDRQSPGYVELLGHGAEGWGWDIVNNRCIHNQKEYPPWSYPRAEIRKNGFKVPETFYMILDLDDKTLAFCTDDTYFGIAYCHLKGHPRVLHPAASAVWGMCKITLKYRGCLHKPHDLQNLCRRKLRRQLGPYTFNERLPYLLLPPRINAYLNYKYIPNYAFLNIDNPRLRAKAMKAAKIMGIEPKKEQPPRETEIAKVIQ